MRLSTVVYQLGVLCYKQKNVKEKASTVQPEKSNRCQLFYEGEKQQCVNSQRGNVMKNYNASFELLSLYIAQNLLRAYSIARALFTSCL